MRTVLSGTNAVQAGEETARLLRAAWYCRFFPGSRMAATAGSKRQRVSPLARAGLASHTAAQFPKRIFKGRTDEPGLRPALGSRLRRIDPKPGARRGKTRSPANKACRFAGLQSIQGAQPRPRLRPGQAAGATPAKALTLRDRQGPGSHANRLPRCRRAGARGCRAGTRCGRQSGFEERAGLHRLAGFPAAAPSARRPACRAAVFGRRCPAFSPVRVGGCVQSFRKFSTCRRKSLSYKENCFRSAVVGCLLSI